MSKFEHGKVVVSDRIKQRLTQSDRNHMSVFINTSLGRFANADWGNVGRLTERLNNEALATGGRVIGLYESSNYGDIIIYTNEKRTSTTIEFLDE